MGISEQSYIRIRDKLARATVTIFGEIMPRIGGSNRIVEIDEMAFRRGHLVSNPIREMETKGIRVGKLVGLKED